MPNRLAPLFVPIASVLLLACGSAPPEDVYDLNSFRALEEGAEKPSTTNRPLLPETPEAAARPEFTPRSETAAEVGRLIVDCDRHLRAWSDAMAAPRSEDNQQVVTYTAQALGVLVLKNRAVLENQAITGAPRNRGIASAALGFCGDPAVLPLVLNNVGSTESEVVAKSLLGIGMLSVPNTPIGPIYTALNSPVGTPEVESNAAFALFQLATLSKTDTDGTMSSTLLGLLSSPQSSVRAQAALSLGLIKANLAIPPVTDLLAADPNPEVRTAAAFALGQIGSVASTRPLVAALSDPSPLTAGTARGALTRIHGRDLGPDAESWRAAMR
jgi:hypothetical protein